jgi:hypothetical protein
MEIGTEREREIEMRCVRVYIELNIQHIKRFLQGRGCRGMMDRVHSSAFIEASCGVLIAFGELALE